MQLRRWILGNLATLTLASIDIRAIASPYLDNNKVESSTISQWTETPQVNPATPSLWRESSQTESVPLQPWRESFQTKPIKPPTWVENSEVQPAPPPSLEAIPVSKSPILDLELQPHTVPSAFQSVAQRKVTEQLVSDQEDTEIGGHGDTESETLTPSDSSESETTPQPVTVEVPSIDSPLAHQRFQLPTAETLRQGEVVINFTSRLFFPPDFANGDVDNGDTANYFATGITWGITDDWELSFQYQHVDSAAPGRQGDFDVVRRPGDNEGTLELKHKFWQNSSQTQTLSGIVSLSFPLADRGFQFREDGKLVLEDRENQLVPALQIPFTAAVDERWRFTIAPTVAFFPDSSALFFRRPPTNNPGSFGTTFGFTTAISFNVNPRLTLWADAFFPITGNNSISRESGQPDTAIAYNVGLRYLVNPRVAIDVFASNTQGSLGALALTADRDLTAIGANLVFMPDIIPANRRYAESFTDPSNSEDSPLTIDGLAFFDGGTVPKGRLVFDVRGGSQGILTAIRYGVLKDLEFGIYLDYVSGDVDESEQGISGKVRLLNQAEGDPLTVSLAATVGLTNQPFVNFVNNNRNEFKDKDLDKSVPFIFQGDDGPQGQFNIVTVSLPLNYQFDNGVALWMTPIVAYVQRSGTSIAGFDVGGSIPLGRDFSIVGEVGVNFVNPGNGFSGNQLEKEIPWTFAIRWDPSEFLGLDSKKTTNRPHLEIYVTNRVGFSTWHQLRVRDQNETAVGVGLLVPF